VALIGGTVTKTPTMAPVNTEPTTVLIASDHPIYRSGLRILLDGVATMRVVGEVGIGSEAIITAHELRPQVVVMDVALRGNALLEVIRLITGHCDGTDVLIVSPLDDREMFLAAIGAGVRGYLANGARWEDLVLGVEIVRSGGLVFDSCASGWALDHLSRSAGADKRLTAMPRRDCDVLELISPGPYPTRPDMSRRR
jgi:DNA-binding NarL/FixJ family response regulator